MMMMPALTRRATFGLAAACLALAAEAALAQDPLAARAEERQRQYVEAVTSGDADAFLGLFTEDAVVLPMTGGVFEGAEGLRRHFDMIAPAPAMEITSERVEAVGNVILVYGNVAIRLPDEAGGRELAGEYVALVREAEGELRIHRLVAFPPRRPPGGAR